MRAPVVCHISSLAPDVGHWYPTAWWQHDRLFMQPSRAAWFRDIDVEHRILRLASITSSPIAPHLVVHACELHRRVSNRIRCVRIRAVRYEHGSYVRVAVQTR